jgi:hypothetical protein
MCDLEVKLRVIGYKEQKWKSSEVFKPTLL